MAIIALLAQKGGSGKTTMASNLGVELHARGVSVSLLDCDPQRSLHSWASLGDGGALRDLVHVIEAGQGAQFREELHYHEDNVDVVIVDCAPGFDPVALQAASVADLVMIPVRPSPLDTESATEALELASIGIRGRDALIAFAPSANLPRTRLGRELPGHLASIGQAANVTVLPSITARIVVAESALSGQAVREVEPGGDAAKEFAAVADQVEEMLRGRT